MLNGRTSVVQELLLDAQDDWVAVHRLVSLVSGGAMSPLMRQRIVRILGILYDQRLMIPGMPGEGGFVPWSIPSSEYLKRSVEVLERLRWNPMNEGFWLDLTEQGEERAAYLARSWHLVVLPSGVSGWAMSRGHGGARARSPEN